MKLAFSTLGCPKWTLNQILENAVKMGFDGIEFRGLLDDIDITRRPEFTTEFSKTRQMLIDRGLAVSCLSTSARFAIVDPSEKQKSFDEVQRYMELAVKLDLPDVPIIRVFGGRFPKGYNREKIMAITAENLRQIGKRAEEYDVTLAVETHDDWSDSALCAQLISQVNNPKIRILWDLHHPYRFNNESPEVTYANIGKYTVGIHIKDSVLNEKGELVHVLVGEGGVPLRKMLDMLIQGGYSGYATLEWEKRWHPELLEPEIVFSHYVQKMREWGFHD